MAGPVSLNGHRLPSVSWKRTPSTGKASLGVDAGSVHIGLLGTREKQTLYAAEVIVRDDIRGNLEQKRSLRRGRRNRTTRYRAPRFDNRTRPDGYLAPSARAKADLHLRAVRDVQKILPVTRIVIEVAPFDTQRINDPCIEGAGYQEGPRKGFENVKAYVRFRDEGKCRHCHGKSGDRHLEVHHLRQRKDGGSDRPDNLITLCHTCHAAHHAGTLEIKAKPGCGLRHAAFMGLVRRYVVDELRKTFRETYTTYGYITKVDRETLALTDSHVNDAFCIAGNLEASPPTEVFLCRKVRCHNRQLHMLKIGKGGKRKANQAKRIVKGFRLFDEVSTPLGNGFVSGRRASGYFSVRTLGGTNISPGISSKKLTLLKKRQSLLTGILAIPPAHQDAGFPRQRGKL